MKYARAAHEIEPKLKSGAPRQLYELARKLAQDVPASPGGRSKAGRGCTPARGKPAAPVKAQPAALDRGMTVNDAFRALMQANFVHLQANERGMLEGRDPEYLHQVRVAVRRLRSAATAFAPLLSEPGISQARTGLKWLGASLGPARDWDVFVTETLPPVAAEFGAHAGLKDFLARCERVRRSARARTQRALRSARYRRFMSWLAAWFAAQGWRTRIDPSARASLEGPVTAFAAAVLEQRYGQVRKRGRNLRELSPVELHRLRIAIKKFRYAADFFAGLYEAKMARAALKRLSRLQDILGAMNDAAAVAELMSRGFGRVPGRRGPEVRGMLLGWSRGRSARLKRELKGEWKEFRSAKKFW